MDQNPNELRAKAAGLLDEAKALNALAKKADRLPTDEEAELIESNMAEVEELHAQASEIEEHERVSAARAQRLNDLSATSSRSTGRPTADPVETSHADVIPGKNRIEYDPAGGFRSFSDFSASVMAAGMQGGTYDNRLDFCAAASGLNQSSPSGGGFLVPTQFANTVMEGVMDAPDSLLSRCDQYTVEGEAIELPAIHETSRADGSRQGGIRGYWLNEADQITSSSPKFRRVRLEPKELAVLVYATDKLVRNSPVALEQLLVRGATNEINFMVGDAIVNGDGVGKPLGILASPSLVTVLEETSQAADTIVTENIDKMWARMPARSRANAVWLINQDCEPSIQQLSSDVGTGGLPLYRLDIQNNGFGTLYGRPVIPVEYCQTIGDLGDIILADLSMYAVGLQGGVSAATSMHIRFDYAEMAFRFMFAVDGQPWLNSAITPKNGSNTISPLVVIEARTG